jgi:hypothetical protein
MVEHPFLVLIIMFGLGAVLTLAGFAAYDVGKKRLVNAVVGFRTYSTRSNPDVWEAINVASGVSFIKLGIAVMVSTIIFRDAVITYFLPYTLLVMGAAIIITVKYAYDAAEMARRLSQEFDPIDHAW